MNPTERHRRITKTRLAGRAHEGTEEAKEMIYKMLRTGEIKPIKMYDYLIL